jgi:hypothetical protein
VTTIVLKVGEEEEKRGRSVNQSKEALRTLSRKISARQRVAACEVQGDQMSLFEKLPKMKPNPFLITIILNYNHGKR